MKADGDVQALSKAGKIRGSGGCSFMKGRFLISGYLNLSKEKEHVDSKRLSLWPPAGGEKGEMYIPLMLADHSQSRSDFNSSSLHFLSFLLLITCVMPYWQAEETAMNKKSDQKML